MEAAGSGILECRKSGLINYFATNHVITPLPDGTAKGTVYTLSGGAYGDPDVIKKNDPYEDIYVKTAQGLEVQAAGARPRQGPDDRRVHRRRLPHGRPPGSRQGRQPEAQGWQVDHAKAIAPTGYVRDPPVKTVRADTAP